MQCAAPASCHASAGAFYFVELWLGFHIGFVGKLNTRKKLIMDGKAVAWFYVIRGQFFVDTLTAVAWIAQVQTECSIPLCDHSQNHYQITWFAYRKAHNG